MDKPGTESGGKRLEDREDAVEVTSPEGGSRSRLSRRSFLLRSGGALGGLALGMYLKPGLTSLQVPRAYAEVSPTGRSCTPGKWKNNLSIWPIDPATIFATAFALPVLGNADINTMVTTTSMFDALSLPGGSDPIGKARNLARIGAAALLNETVFGSAYPSPPGGVAAAVRDAFVSGAEADMEAVQTMLDDINNDNDCQFLVDGS